MLVYPREPPLIPSLISRAYNPRRQVLHLLFPSFSHLYLTPAPHFPQPLFPSPLLTTLPRSVRLRAVEAPYTAPHPQGQAAPDNWDAAANGEWPQLNIRQPLRARFEAKDALVDDVHGAHVPHAHTRQSGLSVLVTQAMTVVINYDPFRVDIKRSDGSHVATINDQGLMHFESFIPREHGEHMFRADWGSEIDTRDLWEERFNSHTDPKPHGPAAVGLDVFFPNANILSGLPSRTVPLNLPATYGSGVAKEPYRMFNLDVFEYATAPFLQCIIVTFGQVRPQSQHGSLRFHSLCVRSRHRPCQGRGQPVAECS